ncbi:thiol:disulfide interchange protein DsbA/DsbL [Vibrio sp. Of7-15]|uniref:thiol:disulfide interchange protein DsbA/DsbL n=1 Tax=Vibrio sp. Of7-15 TaxID=2724879 RepID=UPI001EF1DECB|nr:thiol:disulfide interchange protein DsbA/DsbL [Vibrio sp. Of7-15]MCG7497237.1 thiol:disulfide interchange protein DsbA/DsbL [Vibrio sp. Of7-15]
MKLIFKTVCSTFFAALLLVGCSENTQPQEGGKYTTLPAPLTQSTIQPVTEVFSLSCGHCRSMEDFIPDIKAFTNTDIDKLHVTFNESAQISALIYYSAVMQLNHNPDATFMEDLFSVVQDHGDKTPKEQRAILEKAFNDRKLLSPYQFDEIQQKALFEMLKQAEATSVAANISSVPTFIVNGKYQVQVSAHENPQDIANTITYLLNKQ